MVGPNNLHSNTVIILLIHLFIPHPAANLAPALLALLTTCVALSALRCECVLDWPWHVSFSKVLWQLWFTACRYTCLRQGFSSLDMNEDVNVQTLCRSATKAKRQWRLMVVAGLNQGLSAWS